MLHRRHSPDSSRLFREPIREISTLQDQRHKWSGHTLALEAPLNLAGAGDLFRIQAKVEIPDGSKLTFLIRGIPLTLTPTTVESGSRLHPGFRESRRSEHHALHASRGHRHFPSGGWWGGAHSGNVGPHAAVRMAGEVSPSLSPPWQNRLYLIPVCG